MTSPRWIAFAPGIAMILAVAAVLLIIGGYRSTIDDHTRQINELRVDGRERDRLLYQIDLRLARIETKLEMIAPERERGR